MKSHARLVLLLVLLGGHGAYGQELSTLEQRQPLELVFADSIVPQDRHEVMLTTGAWYSRQRGDVHDAIRSAASRKRSLQEWIGLVA